ncbi:hypothetical protein [Nonomuraea sp. JJY05]|uniref:hypothetical protein n=1 Tax=Nonomuraea sp. JJY05 TaxID=3350255 RepID=UPI00373ED765
MTERPHPPAPATEAAASTTWSSPRCAIAQEEVVGRVLTSIPYTGHDQAVEISNSTT